MIASGASVTITGSTFSSNFASNGGAIASLGTFDIVNSSIVGNEADNDGGGISSAVASGARTVTASTVTGNRANSDDDLTGEGGGMATGPCCLVLSHTIVADNFDSPTDRSDVAGPVNASSSFNIIGVDTGLTGIEDGEDGNQIGTSGTPLDPMLGPLQDNGGPTPTRAPLAGSPALEGGSGSACSVDQRGFPRPLDGDSDGDADCDVGAVEVFGVASAATDFFTVTPCRIADTRDPDGPSGGPALAGGTTRVFPVTGLCSIPSDATAVALNVTAVNETVPGHLRLYPAAGGAPGSSTINFIVGQTRGNNAVVPLGVDGQLAVMCVMFPGPTQTTHAILDVFGYFK